jgi:hypothetical protein
MRFSQASHFSPSAGQLCTLADLLVRQTAVLELLLDEETESFKIH